MKYAALIAFVIGAGGVLINIGHLEDTGQISYFTAELMSWAIYAVIGLAFSLFDMLSDILKKLGD